MSLRQCRASKLQGGWGLRSISPALFRWDISLALNMTKKKSVIARRRRGNPLEKVWSIYFITLVVGYFAYAQYDGLFLLRHSERSEESHRRTDGSYTFSVGYFANAQYDVLFLYVILSMSSEQICLQILAKQKRAPKPKRFRGAAFYNSLYYLLFVKIFVAV